MRIPLILSLTGAIILPTIATAQTATLERGLLKSMSITINSEGDVERNTNSGAAISAYKRVNLIKNIPDLRYDYTDNYLLMKPAKLLGHDLKIIEEEYPSQYLGCCVSPGVGVVIRQNGSLNKLQRFAQKIDVRLSHLILMHILEA